MAQYPKTRQILFENIVNKTAATKTKQPFFSRLKVRREMAIGHPLLMKMWGT
jgi:hypothetical protein